MKSNSTVFVIDHSEIKEGVVIGEGSAQGFYTRWSNGYRVRFTTGSRFTESDHSSEKIFTTREAAKEEFGRRRRIWPQHFKGAA